MVLMGEWARREHAQCEVSRGNPGTALSNAPRITGLEHVL